MFPGCFPGLSPLEKQRIEWLPVHPEVGDEWIKQWICRFCVEARTLRCLFLLHWVWWSRLTLDMPPVVALHVNGQPFLLQSNEWRMCQVGFHQDRCRNSAHCMFGFFGPLTALVFGTQSWMFCPLISLGLNVKRCSVQLSPFQLEDVRRFLPTKHSFGIAMFLM